MSFNISDYEKWLTQFKNPYLAVVETAALAREKVKNTEEYLSSSDALEWIITGKKSKSVITKSNKLERSYMYNLLSEVSNKDIIASVVKSIYVSKNKSELIFIYVGNLDDFQKSRVRILCRMIRYQNT